MPIAEGHARLPGVPEPAAPHVVVVGGGISGLAAALALRRNGPPGLRTTVLEASAGLGGKLRTSAFAGVPIDEGAEAFLARRPEALELAASVGLAAELVAPATTAAGVWTRGRIRPFPGGTLLGVPTSVAAVARSRVLSAQGTARLLLDRVLPAPPVPEDLAVGRYVAGRLGREVVDRLVDPLLGGVYAGRADLLSLAATIPSLAAVAGRGGSLLSGAKAAGAAAPPYAGPLFQTLPAGLGRLAEAVAAASGADLRLGTTVRELTRAASGGWLLTTGSTARPQRLAADAVILAVPAAPAARLLAAAPAAAGQLAAIDYASVAIVTLAYAGVPALTGSGFLVPAVDGRLTKAATFSTAKWSHVATAVPGLTIVRCSVGRYGDPGDLQRDDEELVRGVAAELEQAVGLPARPVESRVTRWGGALPQYAVGHLDRVARIRSGLAGLPGLAVCGAAYDGVGVPACVASGRRAAGEVLRSLGVRGQGPGPDLHAASPSGPPAH